MSTPAVLLDDFLLPHELQVAQAHLAAHASQLAEGWIVDSDRSEPILRKDVRSVRVLRDTGAIGDVVAHRVHSLLPWILTRLDEPPIDATHIETEFTVSVDGDFFAAHRDNAGARVRRHAARTLTFVVFVHHEPKGFTGGDLRIFRGAATDDSPAVTVVPCQDVAVFFPSRLLHAVSPVRCSGRGLASCRLALTGWVHGG